jgi:hypothetical protein
MFDKDSEGLKRRLAKTTYIFNAESPDFTANHEHNIFFIQMYQNYFNDLLLARGYVFLNEVLTKIGLKPTMIGQLAGWRKDASGYIEIKIEQTMMSGLDVKEYFLKIEHDGLIFDVLGD